MASLEQGTRAKGFQIGHCGGTTKACVESQVAKNGILYESCGHQASTGNELTRTRSLGLYGLRNFQHYGEFDGIWEARPPGGKR
jgi:hypothetical protein